MKGFGYELGYEFPELIVPNPRGGTAIGQEGRERRIGLLKGASNATISSIPTLHGEAHEADKFWAIVPK
jgi:hypothetical protein